MRRLFAIVTMLFVTTSIITSCAQVSKRMPNEIEQMHNFLTQHNSNSCWNYHYNFEREAPRLYSEQKQDSLLDVIDYIRTECGPSSNLDITRTLVLADQGKFGDSLIGSATLPQMLLYRSENEYLLRSNYLSYLYGHSQSVDNTHDNYNDFRTKLANNLSSSNNSDVQVFGLFYSGNFDSAFSRIQSDELKNTKIKHNYDRFVSRTKNLFPDNFNFGIYSGSWRPQGDNKFLGNHPEIGIQFGGEGNRFRSDIVINYRFSSAENEYIVDSLGQLVSTDVFNSWLLGIESGYKIFDNSLFSSDLFVGIGYDFILSLSEEGDPEDVIVHGSIAASVGLRHRIFLNKRTGLYLGGIIKYSYVDYGNPKGTSLSGNTISISLVTGWSFNETLKQFLTKLNYKGNWRAK